MRSPEVAVADDGVEVDRGAAATLITVSVTGTVK
jgi:hypothetical protein